MNGLILQAGLISFFFNSFTLKQKTVFMTTFFTLAQIMVADTAAVAVQAEELTLSYWELAFKGGLVMIPILILSIIAVFIFVERYFVLRSIQHEDVQLMNRVKDNIHEGKVESAMAVTVTIISNSIRPIMNIFLILLILLLLQYLFQNDHYHRSSKNKGKKVKNSSVTGKTLMQRIERHEQEVEKHNYPWY